MSLEQVRADRLAKLHLLQEKGINPYPAQNNRTHTIQDFLDAYGELEESKKEVTLAGRIMSVREHGALMFVDLFDGTAKTQIYIERETMGEELFELLRNATDAGDFVEFTGTTYTTKRGMQSLGATNWRMLAKSLRAMPDEWFGLKDENERYRRRYVDILLSKETADRVRRRSMFWNTIRSYLLDKGFVEVETPVFETTTGGADARPFVTHHNALDMDVYLRISAGELWQKRLLVAGLPKVFEIGRIFRNEGMSFEHLQDYTQLEYYEAFSDYKEGMEMTIDLYRTIAQKVYGTMEFTIKDFTVDLSKEWEMYDYCELISKEFSINPLKTSIEEIQETFRKHSISFDPKGFNIERGVDILWKHIRKSLSGPGFLVNVPVYLEPLAKKSSENPEIVERFQVLIAGSEIGKGFSELNDPLDQHERFEHQQKLREQGDDEAQMNDSDYVEALEYGMPPAFGFGVSERLFSFLEGVSVREGQIFPLMKPQTNE
jgi:lysyl-tRNA synthetase class 2